MLGDSVRSAISRSNLSRTRLVLGSLHPSLGFGMFQLCLGRAVVNSPKYHGRYVFLDYCRQSHTSAKPWKGPNIINIQSRPSCSSRPCAEKSDCCGFLLERSSHCGQLGDTQTTVSCPHELLLPLAEALSGVEQTSRGALTSKWREILCSPYVAALGPRVPDSPT